MLPGLNRFSPYKALVYADRIRESLSGKSPPPVIAHFYPTNRCTSNCPWCIMLEEKARFQGDISFAVAAKALEGAAEFGVKCVHFSGGGEPTLHRDLGRMAELARKLGMTVALSTNLQPEVDVGEFATHCNHIRVSLNAPDEQTYCRAMRVSPPAFERVVRRIEEVVKVKAPSADGRYNVGLAMLVNDNSAPWVYDFCELANRLGVGFVHIRPEFSRSRERGRRIRAAVPVAERLAAQAREDFPGLGVHAVTDKFRGYWSGKEYDKCRACWLNVTVGADGTMRVCQDVLQPSWGDLSQQSFREAWESEGHRRVVDEIDLDNCPRCVLENANEIIQRVFLGSEMKEELL